MTAAGANRDSAWAQLSAAVIPLPRQACELHQRGFNLPELIVRHALKIVGGKLALNAGVREPRRETQSRTGLIHHQGRKHMRGVFTVVRPQQIAGREVLLADDVLSTGPTVSECGCFLRRAAVSRIDVATVARAQTAPAGGKTLPRNLAADRETLAALAYARGS